MGKHAQAHRTFYGPMTRGDTDAIRKVAPCQRGFSMKREMLRTRIWARIDALHEAGDTGAADALEMWMYRVTNCGGAE